MNIEYEATFLNIDKEEARERLKKAGAKLVKPEILMKRCNFTLPKNNEIAGSWVRVRDEGDKITMSVKIMTGDKIEDQKEICLSVDEMEKAIDFLETLGCRKKSYQETKRETWELDSVIITLDTWPFLEPFAEVEGQSEQTVKSVSEKIGFDYTQARFCAVGTLYHEKYKIPQDVINNHTPEITFAKNPFINNSPL
ncbi:MAG: CYTH domain-containing protein [Patescibacteria group bacterium]|nr:CYTH domain-containing protein [Patescibacteria group bacterium]